MTVRKDLDELDKAGKIVRIHGGAQSISYSINQELSHAEKQALQIDEKSKIAQLAASYVEDGDTIFLSPGTTIELLAQYLINKHIRIITNNYAVFEILKQSDSADIILTGGDFRRNTWGSSRSYCKYKFKKVKLYKDDFYVFYNLHDIDYLITDCSINKDVKIHYNQYVNLIIAEK